MQLAFDAVDRLVELVEERGALSAGEAARQLLDLETTGLAAASARICEIGAVRIERLAIGETFQTLVAPGVPLPRPISVLTGLRDEELRRAPRVEIAMRRFVRFAGDAALAAHNARFDLSFLNRQLERVMGRRHAGAPIDTVALARRLLAGRTHSTSLATLAHFFGTSASP